jgi:hypothetical protein
MDKIEVTRVHAITLESKNLFECWGVEDAHLAYCNRAGMLDSKDPRTLFDCFPCGTMSESHGRFELYYGIGDSSLFSVVTNLPIDPT